MINRWPLRLTRNRPLIFTLAAAPLVLGGSGCSTDVSRFEPPDFSLTDDASAPPRPPNAMRSNLSGADSAALAAASRLEEVQREPIEVGALSPASAVGGARTSPARGETVEVQRGDTLFGLAKRHGVTISDLERLNGLDTAVLKPGQKLVLPAGARVLIAASPPDNPRAPPASRPVPARVAGWSGSYTIKTGDSLYLVARRHKVSLADLETANAISNPRRVRPGTVLRVPGPAPGRTSISAEGASQTVNPDESSRLVERAGKYPADGPDTPGATAPSRAAPAVPGAPPGASVDLDPSEKLRWPVRGRIVTGFGPRSDGTHNDGLNIAVPMGADVHAAEGGVVAYAGNELEGYGNLVLVRHDNGWVTAYAHNRELLVERGDRVMRGQAIARAGNTGRADQPQVHFELRQSSKPVDPMPFLENL